MSYLYNGVFGLLITAILGYILSLVTRKIDGRRVEDENYDPNLFIPSIAKKLTVSDAPVNLTSLTALSSSDENLKNGLKSKREYY